MEGWIAKFVLLRRKNERIENVLKKRTTIDSKKIKKKKTISSFGNSKISKERERTT